MKETESDERALSRRRVVQTAAGVLAVPSFANVVVGETDSGNIELTTTATVPTDTTLDIRVYEDTNGDDTPDYQQIEEIPDGSNVTTEYAALTGGEGLGYRYWMDIELSTNDDSVTPSLDAMTITLPADESTPEPGGGGEDGTPIPPPDEPQGASQLWNNYQAFVGFIVLAFTIIGAWSKSLAVGAVAGYMAFLYIALTSGTALFENIAYLTLVLVFLGTAFKIIRLEFEGET